MNFKEFVDGVNLFLKEHPEAGELLVITASDDEGNDFNQVSYTPSMGKHVPDEREFLTSEQAGEKADPNAVCIN